MSCILLATFLLAFLSGSLFFSLGDSSADSVSSDISVEVDPMMAIATNTSNLSIPIVPTPTGTLAMNDLLVMVSTNNPTGYTLTMNSETNSTALAHLTLSNTIPSTTATQASPAALAANRWGYSLATSPTTFSAIPPLASPDTITETDAPGQDSSTRVTFAANLDSTVASGTYLNTIIFSTTANYVPPPPLGDGMKLQDVTAAHCAATPVGVTANLVDARDGNQYRVRKMLDNKCWMIDNLAYAGGGTDTYGDVVPIGSGTGNITFANACVNATAPCVGASLWNTTTGTTERYMTTNNFTGTDLQDRNGNTIQNTTATLNGGTQCTNSLVGTAPMQSECLSYLYNWCAAIGLDSGTTPTCAAVEPTTTGTNMTTAGVVGVASGSGGVGGESKGSGGTSICPTGWRLPVGRVGATNDDPSNALNEFAILNASMNSGVYNPIPNYTGTGIGFFENWQPAGAFSVIGSGNFDAANGLDRQSTHGLYWSSSLDSATRASRLFVSASSVNPGAGYYNKHYGVAVRCVLN